MVVVMVTVTVTVTVVVVTVTVVVMEVVRPVMGIPIKSKAATLPGPGRRPRTHRPAERKCDGASGWPGAPRRRRSGSGRRRREAPGGRGRGPRGPWPGHPRSSPGKTREKKSSRKSASGRRRGPGRRTRTGWSSGSSSRAGRARCSAQIRSPSPSRWRSSARPPPGRSGSRRKKIAKGREVRRERPALAAPRGVALALRTLLMPVSSGGGFASALNAAVGRRTKDGGLPPAAGGRPD